MILSSCYSRIAYSCNTLISRWADVHQIAKKDNKFRWDSFQIKKFYFILFAYQISSEWGAMVSKNLLLRWTVFRQVKQGYADFKNYFILVPKSMISAKTRILCSGYILSTG